MDRGRAVATGAGAQVADAADRAARTGEIGLGEADVGQRLLERRRIDDLTTEGKLSIDPTSPVLAQLAALVASARAKELSLMSNRRLVKFSAIILAEALLRSAAANLDRAEILPRDLMVLLDFGLDQHDPGTVEKLRQELLLT